MCCARLHYLHLYSVHGECVSCHVCSYVACVEYTQISWFREYVVYVTVFTNNLTVHHLNFYSNMDMYAHHLVYLI